MTASPRPLHYAGLNDQPVHFIGEHPLIQALLASVDRFALSDMPVLLVGATGTGKELIARRVHDRSGRRGAFVAVNAAALPETLAEAELFGVARGAYTGAIADRPGLFEQSHDGTLFLDEATDLSISMQARLLRVLESGVVRRLGDTRERRVDVRLVLSSHMSGGELVGSGRWRSDFYYRVSGLHLCLPLLKDRSSDLPNLINHFLASHGRKAIQITSGELDRCEWRGNVRQLKSAVDRAVLMADGRDITCADISRAARMQDDSLLTFADDAGDSIASLRSVTRSHLDALLEAHGGSVKQAARALGISESQAYRRLQSLGIAPPRRPRLDQA